MTKQENLDARLDYQRFLLELGITEHDVQRVTHSVPVVNVHGVFVGPSEIEGLGLFASRPVAANKVIAPVLLRGEKTLAGRYSNHSSKPNARMVVLDRDNINLVAIQDIGDEEITTDYKDNLAQQALRASGVSSRAFR